MLRYAVSFALAFALVFSVIVPAGVGSPIASAQTGPGFVYEVVDLNGGGDLIRARSAAIDLMDYPVLPTFTRRAEAIFRQGQALGRDETVLSKVGDCNSIGWVFLHPFGLDQYDLGEHAALQPVVNHFSESMAYRTYAAANGLNANAVLDPIWASPTICEAGESPLACEYRVHNPAIAVIMFGTNDIVTLTDEQFDHNLRRVVNETIRAGIVPVLSTFPRHLSFPERSIRLNQIAVRVALDFSIPLVNLWRALEPLPNHGIAPDNFHLSGPQTRAGDMSYPNLETGFPLRNLITLQALDVLLREVIVPVAE